MPGRGRKVAEGIYLQTSGRYYATVSYDDPETTKRRTISGTFDTLDQAKDWRLVNKVKRQRKQLHPGERTVATLLAAYADYMIEGEHWSRGGTVTSNETMARLHVIPFMGHMPIRDVKAGDIEDLFSHLSRKGLSGSSITKVKGLLSGGFNQARVWDWVDDNPTTGVRAPEIHAPDVVPIPVEVVQRLRAAADNDVCVPWMRTAIYIAMSTGMRRGEIAGLRWRHLREGERVLVVEEAVKHEARSLHVDRPKNEGSRRKVTVPKSLIPVLVEWREVCEKIAADYGCSLTDESRIIGREPCYDSPRRPDAMSQTFKRFADRLGIDSAYTLHGFRHSYISQALAAGIPPAKVMLQTGHSNMALMLKTYAHWVPSMGDEVADEMDDLLFRQG